MYVTKANKGSGDRAACILKSSLGADYLLYSSNKRLTPSQIVLGAHFVGGWVGRSADLSNFEERKHLLCRESNALLP
jgi:hypothetical protein